MEVKFLEVAELELMGARKWDDIFNNLDALTPEDREEIARKVIIVGEMIEANKDKKIIE